MRTIRTERESAAPVEAAWDALTDISSYRERNPRVVDVDGRSGEEGETEDGGDGGERP